MSNKIIPHTYLLIIVIHTCELTPECSDCVIDHPVRSCSLQFFTDYFLYSRNKSVGLIVKKRQFSNNLYGNKGIFTM